MTETKLTFEQEFKELTGLDIHDKADMEYMADLEVSRDLSLKWQFRNHERKELLDEIGELRRQLWQRDKEIDILKNGESQGGFDDKPIGPNPLKMERLPMDEQQIQSMFHELRREILNLKKQLGVNGDEITKTTSITEASEL